MGARMRATIANVCSVCQGPIERGEVIYHVSGQTVMHVACYVPGPSIPKKKAPVDTKWTDRWTQRDAHIAYDKQFKQQMQPMYERELKQHT